MNNFITFLYLLGYLYLKIGMYFSGNVMTIAIIVDIYNSKPINIIKILKTFLLLTVAWPFTLLGIALEIQKKYLTE